MTRAYTLRTIVARARRAALSVLIVVVAVATITGTLVFTDTIHGAYRALFSGSARGADVIVTGRAQISGDPSAGATIPEPLVARLRRLPGVAAAAGQVIDTATIVGRGGGTVQSERLPTSALSDLPAPFTGLRVVTGRAPTTAGEVALDSRTAADEHVRVGDSIGVVTGQPLRQFTVTGIADLGPAAVGGERFVVFTLGAVQTLYAKPGAVDQIDIAAAPHVRPVQIAREVAPLLPPSLTVHTQRGQVDLEQARVSARIATLDGGLLAFSVVAVVIAGLLILNTFAITATQRARELSLLRVLGASRGQVVRASVLESLALGLTGSVAGVLAGPLVALAIRAGFDVASLGLPGGGLVLRPAAGLIGLGTGVVSVVLAALVPAVRATRATPLAALRGGLPRPGRRRDAVRAGVATAVGAGGLVIILTASGASGERLRASAAGGALLLVGTLIASVPAVRGVARITGRFRRRDPIYGLAREQVLRSPGRAAVSASALTVGVAFVVLVTSYTSGLRAATGDAIRSSFAGDLAIESSDGTSLIPGAAAQAAASVPGLVGLSSLRTAEASVGSAGDVTVNAIDPTSWGSIYRFQWVHGSSAVESALTSGQVLVEADTARAAHVRTGDRLTLVTGAGQRAGATVAGVYRDAGLLPGITIATGWFASLFHQPRLRAVFVKLGPGASRPAAIAALSAGLQHFPGVIARSEAALASTAESNASSVTGLFYALLVLSLVMSLIGIAGTLQLSVHERTQELGLLRAVGMTADQARELIRDESALSAGVGCLGGIAVGLIVGWAVDHALAPQGFRFTVPWLAVGLSIVVGGLAGTLAAVPPARRASRLDVLEAIAHE